MHSGTSADDGRDCVLKDQLFLTVVLKQDRILIERPNFSRQLDAAYEVDRDRTLIFSLNYFQQTKSHRAPSTTDRDRGLPPCRVRSQDCNDTTIQRKYQPAITDREHRYELDAL